MASAGCGEDAAETSGAGGAGASSSSSAGGGSSSDVTSGSGGATSSSGSGAAGGEPVGATALGIDLDKFTLDGRPTFLLGVSYFDGKNWRVEDLDGLAARGFNLIRVWLDWGTAGFFDGAGNLAEAQRLLDLAEACRQRGIVLDATILDTDLVPEDRDLAVRSVVKALAGQPNVLFDIANEHDHAGEPLSHEDVASLAASARSEDADALLTVSSQGGHLVDDAGVAAENVQAEIVTAGLNIVTPHLPRTPDFYDRTDERVTKLRDHLASIGVTVPVYLQEEARRGHSGLDPTLEQFLQAAREARDAGAAAWILHTDAGFDLATASFFDQLDDVEKATVDALGAEIFGP